MKLAKLDLQKIEIPFHERFTHSSAERSETESIWITAQSESGQKGYGESCPRTYVTGESLISAKGFFAEHCTELIRSIRSLEDLKTWIEAHRLAIDENPAAWCAIELALLDLIAKGSRQSIEGLLGLSELAGLFHYSAVIGAPNVKTFKNQVLRYLSVGFADFKIKLTGELENDTERLDWLKTQISEGMKFRGDANNLWTNSIQAVEYLKNLDFPFWAIEEPLIGEQFDELRHLGQSLGITIILDESVTMVSHLNLLDGSPERWIINLRVSKMGGLIRSLDIVETARERRISLVVGAQVGETSLLTRAALTVAQHARDILIAQEGAFGSLLLKDDICNPPLMFGKRGVLDGTSLPLKSSSGFGVSVPTDLPFLRSF